MQHCINQRFTGLVIYSPSIQTCKTTSAHPNNWQCSAEQDSERTRGKEMAYKYKDKRMNKHMNKTENKKRGGQAEKHTQTKAIDWKNKATRAQSRLAQMKSLSQFTFTWVRIEGRESLKSEKKTKQNEKKNQSADPKVSCSCQQWRAGEALFLASIDIPKVVQWRIANILIRGYNKNPLLPAICPVSQGCMQLQGMKAGTWECIYLFSHVNKKCLCRTITKKGSKTT